MKKVGKLKQGVKRLWRCARGDHNFARLEYDLERWAFDRERMLKEMAAPERQRAEGRGESNLVQVKNFQGGGAETRRKWWEGEDLGGWVSDVRIAGTGESNLVQAKFFPGTVGRASREAVKIAEFQARHPLTWLKRLKPGVNEKREEFCLSPEPAADCVGEVADYGGFHASALVRPSPFLIAKWAGWEYDWTLTLDALECGLGCSIPVGKARSRSQLDLRN